MTRLRALLARSVAVGAAMAGMAPWFVVCAAVGVWRWWSAPVTLRQAVDRAVARELRRRTR